ncbi:MAG: Trk system potassium transporter TrkA [Candidatus Latescibacteria bacterium]|nr:Trk system potassium transporter TrkA [Candidatus Latescibacterota bacterium]NIM22497.1 Trk system potassium transporter TrkA [Candidatus Latescibacterota bacterium]NIM64811.1 Trk system potassium transporter TrkA [Candidatus Latescibacterota bacterium]NIO01319.1 Trk system potassium transporter TrkA [Candidatus Latescibacterota bacterium]NIO27808.1 Trk system potassium transporter TrkA [Candidatus Latescibacterota bacterium]
MNVLIIGAGDIGLQLGKRLSKDKHDITMIELKEDKVKRASEQLDAIVIEGHGAHYGVLQQARLENAQVVAAMTDREGVNLLASKIAKKAGVPTTIARVRNPEFIAPDFILKPEELGADIIIHPEKETADAIVRLIRQSSATHVIEFAEGKIQLLGVRLERGSPLLRTPLIDLARRYGDPPLRVVAINRNQQTLIPKGEDRLLPGDQIFVICDPDYIPKFISYTGKADTKIEDIMILGGGLIGQFVATCLGKEINIKIVESNAHRSEEIAEALPGTLVIHGDGTDIDLLATEGIVDMDAFIAATGDDETNIIATLVARHLKIPRTIALVNKIEYLPLTPTIGMDAVVSKQLLTVNAVERFIQHQQVTTLASVPGVDARFVEFVAEEHHKITRKPLKNIQFPKNAIVGAVMHGDQMIIPRGDTQIAPEDKVVVLTQTEALEDVEKLFQ